MTTTQFTKFISALNAQDRRNVIMRVQSTNIRSALAKSRAIMEKVEREMRIQKLEIALKNLNLNRSWI